MPTPTPVIVEVSGNGASWWAIPVVGGIFALIGVAIAQTIAVLLDRRRRGREDLRRLDSVLREATKEYVDAIQLYATFVTSLNVGEVLIDDQPTSPGSTFWEYGDRFRAIDEAIATLQLVAPSSLFHLAQKALPFMHDFNIQAQRVPMTEELKYAHADEIYNLRSPFVNAVRQHFGLESLPEQLVNPASLT